VAITSRAEPQPLPSLSSLLPNLAPIRLVIADVSTRARTTLSRAVATAGIVVVAEAATGDDVIRTALSQHADVILITMALVYAAARPLIRELAERAPDSAVVVIGSTEDEGEMIDAIRAGASGYVHRDATATTLVREIVETAGGDVVLSRADARRLVRHLADETPTNGASTHHLTALSPRECEVIQLMAQGQTAREIAETLGISRRTVEGHAARILEKLGAKNRADAVRRYIEAR